MAINGDECAECVAGCRLGGNAEDEADRVPGTIVPSVSASVGWAVTLSTARTVPQ
jgi:hypothetical protein